MVPRVVVWLLASVVRMMMMVTPTSSFVVVLPTSETRGRTTAGSTRRLEAPVATATTTNEATTTTTTEPTTTTTTPTTPDPSCHPLHDFWHTPAVSADDIRHFCATCLAHTEDNYYCDYDHDDNESNDSTTTTTTTIRDSNQDELSSLARWKQRIRVLSVEPPLIQIHDLVPLQACQELIQTAQEARDPVDGQFLLSRSTTGATLTQSSSRTSSTVWLKQQEQDQPVKTDDNDTNDTLDQDQPMSSSTRQKSNTHHHQQQRQRVLLRALAEQVSRVSGLPPACLENLQVCRYEPGQEFQLHTDHQNSFNDLTCRGRLATCLVYLQAPTVGGATWFPGIAGTDTVHPGNDNNKQGLCVEAQAGSALFFWNTVEKPALPDSSSSSSLSDYSYTPDMFLHADLRLRHAGLPVHAGEKWICNQWIHPIALPFGVQGVTSQPAAQPTTAQ